MKNSKLKLRLYEIAIRWRLVFYLVAWLIVLIPISIVIITNNAFNLLSSDVIINTSITFFITGEILTSYKKTIENGAIPWANVGIIAGLLIVLVSDIFK